MILFKVARPPQGSHFIQAFLLPLLYTSFLALTVDRYLDLPWGLWVELVLLALVTTLVASNLRRHRQPSWTPYYLGFLGLALLYVVNGLLFTGSLALSAVLVVTWFFGVIQVFGSSLFARHLHGRADLWANLHSYDGEELRVHARDYQEEANFTPGNKIALSTYLRLMTLLTTATILGLWGPDFYPLLGFLWVLLLSLEALYRSYRTEMELFSLGHRITLSWSVVRLATGLGLVAGAWIVATIVAEHLPHFGWGVSRPAPLPTPVEPAPQPRFLPPHTGQPGVFHFPDWLLFFPRLVAPLWTALLAFLGTWGIPILAFLLIVIPGYRLLRSFRLRPRALTLAFLRRWYGFINFFRRLWALLRRKPLPEPLAVTLSNRETWLGENRTHDSRLHRSRRQGSSALVQGFLLLLDLGEELGVVYHRGSTTAEYLQSLAGALPDQTVLLDKISRLLDAGFFREIPLSDRERKDWERTTRLVLDAGQKARHNVEHDHRTKNP